MQFILSIKFPEEHCEGLGTRLCPYWLFCELLAGAGGCVALSGATGLLLCAFVFMVDQYIMWVPLQINTFGAREFGIVALRNGTMRSTYRLL